MDLIRGLHNIREHQRACAATIGNFDGVHSGHKSLFDSVLQRAASLKLPSCSITFEPLPAEYFAPQPPPRLMSLREKYQAIKQCGISQLLILPFNQSLASTEAETFIENVLINGLQVKHLTVGDDFNFGRKRRGDVEMLKTRGQGHFDLVQASTVLQNSERVSSSRIRALLKDGKLAETATLSGRTYSIQGRVVYGQQLGRKLSFPTANIHLNGRNPPLRGVFTVGVEMLQGNEHTQRFEHAQYGVANIGTKPTLNGSRTTLEVHLLDYPLMSAASGGSVTQENPIGDLYGTRLRVSFLHKLRDEKKFSSLDELKQAISDDESSARMWLSQNR